MHWYLLKLRLQSTCIFLLEHPKDGIFAHVLKRGTSCNLERNIRRLFHFLAQFLYTTSEKELDYYHRKVNVRVASRIVERLKTYDLKKLGNFKKIPKLGFDGEYPTHHPKDKF